MMEIADPVSTIASVGLSLTRIVICTGEEGIDGFVVLLGTPPSRDPVIENSEALGNHERCDFARN